MLDISQSTNGCGRGIGLPCTSVTGVFNIGCTCSGIEFGSTGVGIHFILPPCTLDFDKAPSVLGGLKAFKGTYPFFPS